MSVSRPGHILLRNGTVLVHEGTHVKPLPGHDILIEGNTIKRIGSGLELPTGGREIDCARKIISPGFVDTHHHVWQTQLKGRHCNHTLMQYYPTGNMQPFNYTPEDVFWGQLAGCLQSIDAGVTTVVDHAHMSYSPEHVDEAIRGSVSSGLRTIFCYTAIPLIKSWSSTLEYEQEFPPSWWLGTLERLLKTEPFGNGRVNLGVALDFMFHPEIALDLWKQVKELNVKLLTSHYVPRFDAESTIHLLSEHNLLTPPLILSHANDLSETEAQTLVKNNIFVSATPETELQMGHGHPVAFHPTLKSHTSLGIDCHSNNSSDMLTQMRLALQHSRAALNLSTLRTGEPARVDVTVKEAFNLGTIQGARAVNMADQIGSLAVGKKADIVVFDATSPGMVCAAEEDPVGAILLHAGVRDIELVIVDGEVRKEGGRLRSVEVLEDVDVERGVEMGWDDVAGHLLESRERIIHRAKGQDVRAAKMG